MNRLFNKTTKISGPLEKRFECGTIITVAPVVTRKIIGHVEKLENESLILRLGAWIGGAKYIRVTYSDIEMIDFKPIIN